MAAMAVRDDMTVNPFSSKLVLFDIDGTLVVTAHAGVRGMNAAFARLYGRAGALDTVSIAGRTDRAIVTDAFRTLGIEPTDEDVMRLRDGYLSDLRSELDTPAPGEKRILPGVEALITALDARDDVTVGLLTGNFAGGAEIKLSHFDLWRRFAFGAFGDDHLERRALVPVAVRACEAHGVSVAPADVVIIGDTPLDVDCARAHGARAVAVATGPYRRDALQDAGAHLVVETLDELASRAAWLDELVERSN